MYDSLFEGIVSKKDLVLQHNMSLGTAVHVETEHVQDACQLGCL